MTLARRVERALEEHQDHEIIAMLRRTEVLDAGDEPLSTSQGKPLGIRMRYSVQFPYADLYFPSPVLAPTDQRVQERSMRIIGTRLQPTVSLSRHNVPRAGESNIISSG